MIKIKIEATSEGVSEYVDVCKVEFEMMMGVLKDWKNRRLVSLCNTPCRRYKVDQCWQENN